MWMLEATMKGMAQVDVAAELGISKDTVKRELQRAMKNGWAEELRERMRATLQESPDVHREILNADTETLHKLSRGYKLKLDAANALANGLGAFRQESHSTKETLSLSAIANEDAPEEEVDRYGFIVRPRVAFQPETVDALPATDGDGDEPV